MKFATALAFIAILHAQVAHAGGCRLFGHTYVAPVVHKQVQQQVYQPPTLNITNVYPQGNTLYSGPTVGQYGQAHATNPNLAVAAVQDQQKLTAANLQAAIQLQMSAQTNQAEVAKLQLVSNIIKESLKASPAQLQTLGISVTQQAATTQQATAGSFITNTCTKCHGAANPKGGIALSSGMTLTAQQGMRITQILSGVNVPEGMKSVINSMDRDTRNGVMGEVLQSWEKGNASIPTGPGGLSGG